MGYDAFGPGTLNYVHRKTVQEIEKQFPRGTFFKDASEIGGKEFDLKPNCMMGHFRGGVSACHMCFVHLLTLDW
jgi:hypothetical protein